MLSWNKKILDYEIETCQLNRQERIVVISWNKKILDYEIETRECLDLVVHVQDVEIRRFSITRLKLPLWCSTRAPLATSSWNKKILDYEIETFEISTVV